MSDKTGPRGPSPYSQSTTGAAPGAPAEPNLPPHAAPLGGTPARGVGPGGLPPSGRADFPPPMTAGNGEASRIGDAAQGAAQDAGARMLDAAAEAKDQGAEAIETLKQEGGAVLEAAQQRASTMFDEQKRAGADQAEGLARAVHNAADQLQETSPQIAGYVHEAASSVDRMARTLRDRGPNQLLHDVQDMARQQPVAFFGAAVLAGFAIARFARASAPAGTVRQDMGPTSGRDLNRDLDRDMDRAMENDLGSRRGMGTTPMGSAGMGPGGATAASPGWTPGEATRGGHG